MKNTIETIIYKGIRIEVLNGFYLFYFNDRKFVNTNIHMAKRMITKTIKFNLKNALLCIN